jgi:hypothetical protein
MIQSKRRASGRQRVCLQRIRMRAIVVAILSAILCNGPLEAQTSNQASLAEQSAVQQTLTELYRAVSTRDAARYRARCTADYLLVERDELMTIDRDIASFVSRPAASGNEPTGWSSAPPASWATRRLSSTC